MIETFEGRVGGSKTYHAVKRMAERMASGATVCTNVDLNIEPFFDYIRRKWGVEPEADQLRVVSNEEICQFHRHTPAGCPEQPVLVVIDEAHIWLDVRDHGRSALKELFVFLTQSRKMHTDVIFITQHLKNLDGRIARLNQFIWRFRDMKHVRIMGLGVWPWDEFCENQYDYDGKTLMFRRRHRKELEVYALYNSYALLSNVERAGAVGKRVLNKVKTKRGKMFKFVICIIVVCLVASVWFGVRSLRQLGTRSKPPAKEHVAAAAPAAPIGATLMGATATKTPPPRERVMSWTGTTLATNSGYYELGVEGPEGVPVVVQADLIIFKDGKKKRFW